MNFLNLSLHLESIQFESDFEKGLWFLMFKRVIIRMCRDDNGAGFFGYSSHPAPNGTGFKFNKRVWGGYEIFFLKPGLGLGRVWVLPHLALSHPDYI